MTDAAVGIACKNRLPSTFAAVSGKDYEGIKHMNINHFFVTGINYKKTDAALRSQYAVSCSMYDTLLFKASQSGLTEVFVISTCNRTEIYGVTEDVNQLIHLLCSETRGDECTFRNISYTKTGYKAVEHLWQVAAGLDSQILGDYEIVGQLKSAVKFAKERGRIGMFTERIVNGALQASKAIRSETGISGGTVSVSFAVIQYLKNCVKEVADKKILIVGTGKIGRSTCRNLIDYLGTKNITLINRTPEKASELANELNLSYAPYEDMIAQSHSADIIIISANATGPILKKEHFTKTDHKVLIDLSIPNNIETSVTELPGIQLVNVDGLSKINDATLKKRTAEVPKAKAILAAQLTELKEWYTNRKHVPVLKAVKQKLMDMHGCSIMHSLQCKADKENNKSLAPVNTEAIQKVINNMAVKMRCANNQPGCNYIQAINDYIDGSN